MRQVCVTYELQLPKAIADRVLSLAPASASVDVADIPELAQWMKVNAYQHKQVLVLQNSNK